jgi:hypothetical protein
MSNRDGQVLSSEQVEYFIQRGHVVIPNCFSREFAESWTTNAFNAWAMILRLQNMGEGDHPHARCTAYAHAENCAQGLAGGL